MELSGTDLPVECNEVLEKINKCLFSRARYFASRKAKDTKMPPPDTLY